MALLHTDLVANLSGFTDEVLDEIATDGHVFAGRAWLRLLDATCLAEVMGGNPSLQYAVVSAAGVPIACAPILRARGNGIYFVYSLRQYFFEHWIESALQLNPDQRDHWIRVMGAVSRYRQFLEWSRASLGDALIVTNPISYRGLIPVSASSPVPAEQVYQHLLTFLQGHARRRGLPLWFLCVEGDKSRLGKVLESGGCRRVFQFHDNRIDVEPFESFDEYLGSFRRTTRRAFLRDIKRTADAGIEFEFIEQFAEQSARFSALYEQTYAKYGKSYFRHSPGFWRSLSAHLTSGAEAIVARKDGELVGFSLLLKSARRGELWTYRIGRRRDEAFEGVPYYFGLSQYGPIQRAIELGYRRVWLGPASYEAKSVRGARQVPLYSYFWFPRHWDRWFLEPYLRLFGAITREEIAASMHRRSRSEENHPQASTSERSDMP